MNFEDLNAILMITLNLMELRRSDLHSPLVVFPQAYVYILYVPVEVVD